jgi:hypothetical protein
VGDERWTGCQWKMGGRTNGSSRSEGPKLDELKVCSSAVDQNILRCRDVCVCYVVVCKYSNGRNTVRKARARYMIDIITIAIASRR